MFLMNSFCYCEPGLFRRGIFGWAAGMPLALNRGFKNIKDYGIQRKSPLIQPDRLSSARTLIQSPWLFSTLKESY